MLILGKIQNVPNKRALSKIKHYLRTFSMFYVKAVFKTNKLEHRDKVKRLLQTQTYLQNTYKTNINIYKTILSILKHINITSNGIIYTKEQINTIKVDKIFKLITFGNLELQKNAIFNEALIFGMKQARMLVKYGC